MVHAVNIFDSDKKMKYYPDFCSKKIEKWPSTALILRISSLLILSNSYGENQFFLVRPIIFLISDRDIFFLLKSIPNS